MTHTLKQVSLVATVGCFLTVAWPKASVATVIDLAAPSASIFASNVGDGRSVVLRDDVAFALTAFGVRMDPLVGAFSLTAEIFNYDLNSNTRGSLISTNTLAFTDLGLSFYDVPLAASLSPGLGYELQIKPFGFSQFNVEFYFFDNPSGVGPDFPYAAGPLIVIDGAGDGVGGRSNFVLAHFELNGAAVPEPNSMLLLGTGALALAAFLRRRVAR